MTNLFMEGFETSVDNSDLVNRGWDIGAVVGLNSQNVLTVPSRTGVAGRGLMMRGPYTNATPSEIPMTTIADFGMCDTKQSIYSLWQSGGFSLGMSATFNMNSQCQIAAGYTYQIVYDGSTYYWAVAFVAGVWTVAYSTNLSVWTPVTQAPPNMGAPSKITIQGSGASATIMVHNYLINAANSAYYSTTQGSSWTEFPVAGTYYPLHVLANASSTAPFLTVGYLSGTGYCLYYSTTVGGTYTRVGTLLLDTVTTLGWTNAYARYMNHVMLFTANEEGAIITAPAATNNYWYSCLDTTDPTNQTNWVKSATSTIGQMNDIVYFPVTGLWYAAGYGGIASATQAGTTANPQGPTGGWNTVYASGTTSIWSITTNGTVLVAVGSDPASVNNAAIYTSTNGTVWTKANRFIVNSVALAAGNTFTNVIWDGARFIVTGGQNNNVIATSPDGVAWTPVYYPDYTEVATELDVGGLGLFSGTLVAGLFQEGGYTGSGGYTPWTTGSTANNPIGIVFGAAAVASNARLVEAIQCLGGTTGSTATAVTNTSTSLTVPAVGTSYPTTTGLTYYFEIVATAVAGTVNMFNIQFAINGVLMAGTLASQQLAPIADTTGINHLLINLPRSGSWTVVDDIYLNNFAGVANIGQIGVCSIIPWTPSSATQSQFALNGTAANNALQVATPLSNSEGSVYATTVGAKDIYGATYSLPANYKVRALQAEGYFSMYGTVGATANVGIISGATETDSPIVNATTTTPVFAKVLADHDPNTGAAWTATAAAAAAITINKTS